jgi:hypothetical protein
MAIMLFVPLKIRIQGTYWNKKPAGQLESFWIKYIFGTRIRINDMENMHIRIWFLGIPIPLKIKIKHIIKKTAEKEKKEAFEPEKPEDPIKIDKKAEEKKHESLSDKISHIVEVKGKVEGLWHEYKAYLKKIIVSYITFSIDFIRAEIGLKNPADTGMTAGIVYTALSIKPLDNIRVNWDYAKPNFNISGGIKMTMNLYGILRTLLSLYLRYKKDRKNEVQ